MSRKLDQDKRERIARTHKERAIRDAVRLPMILSKALRDAGLLEAILKYSKGHPETATVRDILPPDVAAKIMEKARQNWGRRTGEDWYKRLSKSKITMGELERAAKWIDSRGNMK